jgi:hypothetical protein
MFGFRNQKTPATTETTASPRATYSSEERFAADTVHGTILLMKLASDPALQILVPMAKATGHQVRFSYHRIARMELDRDGDGISWEACADPDCTQKHVPDLHWEPNPDGVSTADLISFGMELARAMRRQERGS